MMEQHIIPYFGNQMMSEITAGQIIQWQNEMQTKGFSEAYLRMIQNQLTYSLTLHEFTIYTQILVKKLSVWEVRITEVWISGQ